jgi:multimeric flavodoxin WrbA
MKITAFVGSARKKSTFKAVEQCLENLQSAENIDYEIVSLNDFHLEICRGCKFCTDKGEEFCPLKDDRDLLIEKMKSSDGILFSTPNYSFQVSGYMKVFLDRLGFFSTGPVFSEKPLRISFRKAFTVLNPS